ncbi:l1 transposable element-related [Anaeramoeba flamelloides]|uniref:L1 transposable element-related n=1 Tax=Anaeramoeba flamelloides TaxID=1746091 RepID=A0AAV7ZE22_9EUKA|nr:l1 transposable element-related [Anaeramoeba flamelloides]
MDFIYDFSETLKNKLDETTLNNLRFNTDQVAKSLGIVASSLPEEDKNKIEILTSIDKYTKELIKLLTPKPKTCELSLLSSINREGSVSQIINSGVPVSTMYNLVTSLCIIDTACKSKKENENEEDEEKEQLNEEEKKKVFQNKSLNKCLRECRSGLTTKNRNKFIEPVLALGTRTNGIKTTNQKNSNLLWEFQIKELCNQTQSRAITADQSIKLTTKFLISYLCEIEELEYGVFERTNCKTLLISLFSRLINENLLGNIKNKSKNKKKNNKNKNKNKNSKKILKKSSFDQFIIIIKTFFQNALPEISDMLYSIIMQVMEFASKNKDIKKHYKNDEKVIKDKILSKLSKYPLLSNISQLVTFSIDTKCNCLEFIKTVLIKKLFDLKFKSIQLLNSALQNPEYLFQEVKIDSLPDLLNYLLIDCQFDHFQKLISKFEKVFQIKGFKSETEGIDKETVSFKIGSDIFITDETPLESLSELIQKIETETDNKETGNETIEEEN